jgi:hypothetical protein
VWLARCDEAARWIAGHPRWFGEAVELDRTSWLEPQHGDAGAGLPAVGDLEAQP